LLQFGEALDKQLFGALIAEVWNADSHGAIGFYA